MRMLFAVAVVLLVGCDKSDGRCKRGVRKVFDLTVNAGGPQSTKPSAEEQAVIDMVVKQSIGVCEKEGLSQAQLDCLLAMKSFDDMKTVTACPAIAAKQPSWLIAGPAPVEPAAQP